jgi:hypothetical protein
MSVPVKICAAAPPRGTNTQPDREVHCQSITAAWAWGVTPMTAMVTYIGPNVPLSTGCYARLECGEGSFSPTQSTPGRHTFWGVCKLDTVEDSSSGFKHVLEFQDNRVFLGYDNVFGTFNQSEIILVDGVRVRRYWHIFPADFDRGARTYTDTPYSAAFILDKFFNAPTVLSNWTRVYHADQVNFPVFDIDASSGKKLSAVVQEVCDKQGLVVGLIGGPYRLVFIRKGEGSLPTFPANSDNRRLGLAISGDGAEGNPTMVRVLGDANEYQLTVNLLPDWATAWEQFVIVDTFADDIYKRAVDPRTGIRFNATPGDPEQYIGRQLAFARANEITLREYVALRNDTRFADQRLFAGRNRMDMPCALYIKVILFRAFVPDLDSITNIYGKSVPADSLTLLDKLLVKTSHNAQTGEITYDMNDVVDGNGYAIVKGYQVGQDAFRTLRPEQFDAAMFADTKSVWQHVPFQADDSGEGQRFIIFDEPVIVANDLLRDENGHKVINAGFTLATPAAKASLVFSAERYQIHFGFPQRDVVENVGGLNGEYVLTAANTWQEVPYADDGLADEKAFEIARPLLNQQFYYYGGGYTVRGSNGTQLTSIIDRCSISFGPDGDQETVDFTNERGRNAFEPQRSLDRAQRTFHLLPGQAELRQEANQARLLAEGFKQNPKFVRSLSELLSGPVGSGDPTIGVIIKNPGTTKLPVGSILRKASTQIGTTNTVTQAVLPAAATTAENVFVGVTVRHDEPADRPLRAQATGIILARVQGPVSANDNVGLPETAVNNLVKDGSVAVGQCQQAIAGATVQLIPVRVGAGGGGGGDARWS